MVAALVRLTVMLAIGAWCSPGFAQELSTLQRIKQSGRVVVGHRDIAIPFSYYNDAHQPIGYSIDICLRIVDAIKAELGLTKLDVTYRELNGATRIPLVANGTVDMECGSTSNDATREQQVSFSTTTFIASPRFVTKKNSGLQTLQSLRGKKMSGVSGTATLRQFSEMNIRQRLGFILEPAKDHAAAFQMLETGLVDAYGAIDTSAYSMIARSKSPNGYFVSAPLKLDPFAIMFRKNDMEMKRIGDRTIVKLFESGEIYGLYRKWFESPLPRFGFNLNMPMSEAMKRIIKHPTDSPNPNDYHG